MHGTQTEIAETLKMGAGRKRRLWPWVIGAALVLIVAFVLFRVLSGGEAAPTFMTSEITRGPLTVTVNTTGELQPLEEVQVGSEVSGLVREVLVDFNDPVTMNQVLARVDTEELEAAVVQAEASLTSSQAQLLQARATEREARSLRDRTRRLVEQNNAAAQTLEANEAAYDRASAAVLGAEADVTRAQAALDSARARLQDAEIRSPMDGFVLDRLVEPGMTVAASLSAPHLFTIAHDLDEMKLQVDVDEASIGAVEEGQHATFTVDAFAGRTFEGIITQVRNAPRETSGVITYEALLRVDNPDGSLRPGMTATADITVTRIDDTLQVPNAALRFAPPDAPRGRFQGDGPGARRTVWVLESDNTLTPHQVVTGVTDGSTTAVESDTLEPGMRVAIGQTGGGTGGETSARGGDRRRGGPPMRIR